MPWPSRRSAKIVHVTVGSFSCIVLCGVFLFYNRHDLQRVATTSVDARNERGTRDDGFSYSGEHFRNVTYPVDFLDMDCTFPLANNRYNRLLVEDPRTFCSKRKFMAVEFDCGRLGHTMSLVYMLFVSGRMLQARLASGHGSVGMHLPVVARCHHCVLCSLFVLPKDMFVVRDYLEDRCPSVEWRPVTFKSLSANNLTELVSSNLELRLWPMRRMYLSPNTDITRSLFKVQPQFVDRAREILTPIRRDQCPSCQLIFVHIRLTDFGSRLKKWKVAPMRGSDVDAAISKFKSTTPNALFLVVTDDKLWALNNLTEREDVLFFNNHNLTSRISFALMTLCDGAILTLGSFGQWASIVGQANGNVRRVMRMVPKKASAEALRYLIQDFEEPSPSVEYFFY